MVNYKSIFIVPVICFCVLLLGCDNDSFVESAKRQVKLRLKDPSSAQFDDVKFYPSDTPGENPHGAVCGKVNAKNSFGAYIGYRRFVMGITTVNGETYRSGVQMEDGSNLMSGVYDSLWEDKCK
ncbi:hypothetical protein BHZ80_09020 [Salmonella enterica]|nr:hypothetical protein [Salmonella enterica]EAA9594469.1 hypothetical protein [Salmonella enterica]EAO9638535.1 hypothetical protein [Salmonella enterica]EKI3323948.1 hypothetical protein [Salmonella enterica]ELK0299940.1 hypothetical protein [Salmonella enterica]